MNNITVAITVDVQYGKNSSKNACMYVWRNNMYSKLIEEELHYTEKIYNYQVK